MAWTAVGQERFSCLHFVAPAEYPAHFRGMLARDLADDRPRCTDEPELS